MTLDLLPASSFDEDELARLFTAGYEGYVVPFAVDVVQLRFMVETFDLDLDASRVAVRDGEQVGLANLGVRGESGWVGGVGVVASARRQGVGEALMHALHEEARRRGLREIRLEVIEQNEAAYRLYVKLGYRLLREVEIGVLEEAVPPGAAEEVPWESAHGRLGGLRRSREPWQREDGTLTHYDDLRGLVTEGGAAVYRPASGDRVIVLQLGGDEAAARELLAALRPHGQVTVFNVPADEPTMAAFRALGGRVTIRQRELALAL